MVKPKLNLNERLVLKELIENGRISNTVIGKKLGISSQAVGKIQYKLEKKGFVKGYTAVVDYEKLGVEVFALAFFRFKSGEWTRLEKEEIRQRVRGPHIIRFFRFREGETTHMVLYGFRSLKEMDNYFHILQTERGHISEIKKVYVLSPSSIMTDSPNELLQKIIDEYDNPILARPEKPKED